MRSVLAGCLIVVACALPAASQEAPAAAVDLRIDRGRVWLETTGATVGQILDEWMRVGGTRIENGDQVPSGPLTLRLNDVSEQEALEVLLRTAGGFVGVLKPVLTAAASRFDRILILPTRAPRVPSGSQVFEEPLADPQPPEAPPVFTEGVQPVLGPDGQPIPDDQAGAPIPPPSDPAGPQAPIMAPPETVEPPATPAGVPRPGMIVPVPQPERE
jgi:hypothetical protein